MTVLGAAVVEAPVGEDCEAQAGDDHVWPPRKGSRGQVELHPLSETNAQIVDQFHGRVVHLKVEGFQFSADVFAAPLSWQGHK